MINYELAKKLKDAGWLQKDWLPPRFEVEGKYDINRQYTKEEIAIVPTLSELIEACGDRFASLNRGIDNKYHCWATRATDTKSMEEIYGDGETTEEAVANLWLELNKIPKTT